MLDLNDLVINTYKSIEPICAEGRDFLAQRSLSVPEAHRKGFCSFGGNLYFIYTIKNKIVRWKRRSMTNKKDQNWGDWKNGYGNDTPIPFYSQFKTHRSDDLFITEGEFDCIAIAQLGAFNCVSLPNGASSVEKTFRAYYEFLQEFETIYIAFDMDQPGQEAAKKAMSLLPPHKYRRINFPYKDANEWVKECDPNENDLKSLMENAEKLTSPFLTHGADVPDEFFDEINIGASTGWPNLNTLLGGIRLKELTVISADTGSGKTTFCLNLCKNLLDEKNGVWINSYEMSMNVVTRKIMGLVLNKCYKVKQVSTLDVKIYKEWCKERPIYLNLISTKVCMKEVRKLVELSSIAYGIKYFLFDHLDYLVSGGSKNTILENIDNTVRELHSLALEFNISIILVAHPKQMPAKQDITINDIKGSSAIKQYADNILLLTRMDRNNPGDYRYRVHLGKNRLFGTEGSIYLHYDPMCDGYKEITFQKNPFQE
jgi:twinkle protein